MVKLTGVVLHNLSLTPRLQGLHKLGSMVLPIREGLRPFPRKVRFTNTSVKETSGCKANSLRVDPYTGVRLQEPLQDSRHSREEQAMHCSLQTML